MDPGSGSDKQSQPIPDPKSRREQLQTLIEQRYDPVKEQLVISDSEGEWKDVLGWRDWSGIRHLWLFSSGVRDQDVERISNLKWPRLEILWLDDNHLTQTGLQTLLTTPIPRLVQLNLINNKIGYKGLQLLTQSVYLKNLEILRLGWNCIGWRGLLGVVGVGWTKLRVLDLDSNPIGNRGVQLLVKSDLPELQSLSLPQTDLTNSSLQTLQKSLFPSLHTLTLHNNNFTHPGYTALHLCNWPSLKLLVLNEFHDEVDGVGLLELVAAGWGGGLVVNFVVKGERASWWGFGERVRGVFKTRYVDI